VSNVRGTNGVEYGVLLMPFQFTLLPPPVAGHFGLTPLENQVLDMQLAITIGGGRMHQAAPPFFAGTEGTIEVADRLFLRGGQNVIETPSNDSLYPLTLRVSGVDRGGVAPVPIAIDITLKSGKGYLLQGADGCEPCVGGLGTRYYPIPNMIVDASRSRITIGDSAIDLASGTFWMDHQWGVGMIPPGASPDEVLRAAAGSGRWGQSFVSPLFLLMGE
jgi:hydroxyneurosporene synthase CrtC